MSAILGISAFYHDSAAALLIDGQIVAAAQEERFTRRKHDARLPVHAIDFCLRQAGISADQLDHVAFYDQPLKKFERIIETYLAYVPAGYRSFRKAIPGWLKQKFRVSNEIRRYLKTFPRAVVYCPHHHSHAASAFFPSPFEEAAILTVDGVGEWSTASIGHGRGHRLDLLDEIRFPHSLGLLYSAFTAYCGFQINDGEYKLMGLAPYGQPIYRSRILERLLDLKADGSLRMDMSYFDYCHGLTMTNRKFYRLFDGPPRQPESAIRQRDRDLAASVQSVTEEAMLGMARHAHARTGSKNLVLAGGVALNCVANGRIQRESPFDQLWIQPAAGDAGGALGAGLLVWHHQLDQSRTVGPNDQQCGSMLGPGFSDDQIRAVLTEQGAVYRSMPEDEIGPVVAALIAQGQVVGWFQGRMEFGPRALGARSILGDARHPDMQQRMNLKIKNRESFRPFAPLVLEDYVENYFDVPADYRSPYMMLTVSVRMDKRSEIPAVTHVDGSARIQTVGATSHPRLLRLVSEFHRQTGCAVMINTSLNVRDEPIACTPLDAVGCFMKSDMDAIVLGNHLLRKAEQQPWTR